MPKRTFVLKAFAVAGLVAWAQTAGAGTLQTLDHPGIPAETYQPDPDISCTHRFTGPFEKGDANIIIQAAPGLLCLDSPGGSLVEALKLTASMNSQTIATKIEADAACESACALVFMAGGFHPHESDKYRWRILHPLGKLGFHAPDLEVAGGAYTEQSVKKAYRLALKSVSETIANLVQRRGFGGSALKSSLLGKMLETPAEAMFYVNTVDEAGQWEIDVGPIPKMGKPSIAQLVQGCVNAYAWRADEPAKFADQRSPENWWPDQAPNGVALKGRVMINELFETGCAFEVQATKPFDISMKFDSGEAIHAHTLMFQNPNLTLQDLHTGQTSSIAVNAPSGICTIYRNGSAVESEPCNHTYRASQGQHINTYEWPSGSKTVTVIKNNTLYINGVKTGYAETIQGQICVTNPKSGNQFCYKD